MKDYQRIASTFEQNLSALVHSMCIAVVVGLSVYFVWFGWFVLTVVGALCWLPDWMTPPAEIAWTFIILAKLFMFIFGLVFLTLLLWYLRIRSR